MKPYFIFLRSIPVEPISLSVPTDTSKALAEIFPYTIVDQLCVQDCIALISLYSDIHSTRLPDYHTCDHPSHVS